MTFNFKRTQIYKAVRFYRLFPDGFLRFYRILLFTLGLIPIGLRVINKVFETGVEINIGWTLITVPFAFSVLFFEWFGNYFLKFPKLQAGDNNMAELLEYEAARVVDRSFELSRGFGEARLSTKALLTAMIEDRVMEKLFIRIIPNFISIRKQLKESIKNPSPYSQKFSLFTTQEMSPEVIKVLEDAKKVSDEHGSERISVLDIMASMFDHSAEFKQFIVNQDLDKEDLKELARWYEKIWYFWREYRKFWSLENLLRQPPIGRDWVFGYARHLISFSDNLTDKAEFARPSLRLVVRQKEINQIEQILSRSGETNVLLVGPEGVGKDRVIFDFAELIARGKVLPQLNYKKVFNLNLSMIAGAAKEVSDIQNILTAILNEATKSGNIILILENIHNFIGDLSSGERSLGRIDVSGILVPYLKSSDIQIIATTDPASFHKYIESKSELSQAFERINISEPDLIQAREMIEEVVPAIESRSGVLVTYSAIKEIINGSDKFIRTAPFPEKAFDLLSEVVSYVVSQKKRIIEKQDVNEVISRKTGVPLGPVEGNEKDKLVHLEEIMHKEIIGQDRAVEVVASTMRRLRSGLAKRGKPAGVFLFVGPTGVGKTLTSKILAKTYFGLAERMLRFDMSEYQNPDSLDRFLGSTKTQEPGQFITAVKDNPFSLILLDEIEKANKDILNIFLQVFDEGRLTDAFGQRITFEQNIIIATSNAGADFIRELVKDGLDPSLEKEKVVDILIKEGAFRPELLNRFDEIVVFHPLSVEQVGKITELLLNALSARLKEQGYEFTPTQDIAEYVAKAGFDPQFGARPMERVIRDKVESTIAKKILNGELKKGVPFSLNVSEIG